MLPLETAQKYLAIVRKRGEAGKPLNRVHRIIRSQELYLLAYAKLYANKGALTPGIDPHDTVDRMSLKKIDDIIDKLSKDVYHWKPVRRTYIEKKNSKKRRPLGMPGWTDKLLEEVIRMVLEAYYEPLFRNCSHGFRPNRGCHTALASISKWKGVRWVIEGDIKNCFDTISHAWLLKHIPLDNGILRGWLKAGYMEKGQFRKTTKGLPQGGIITPLTQWKTFFKSLIKWSLFWGLLSTLKPRLLG